MRAQFARIFAHVPIWHNRRQQDDKMRDMEPHPGDDFASITESAPLVAELRTRIERDGPITFRDFIEAALYHPRWGYYATRREATSRGGDFVTSPEVHSIFGTLVARQLVEMWDVMSRPMRFDVVEQGAGRGLLARDIVAWAKRQQDGFGDALRYRIVEPIGSLRDAQRTTLSDAGIDAGCVEWTDAMPDGIEGCILSNELLDAFAFHRVVGSGGELREVHVAHDGRLFVDELRPLSDPVLALYFSAIGILPGEGCYAEVNLEAPRWTAAAARALRRGFVLTFDYGYEARELYAPWRRDGTLLCCYRQSASSDPYQRIGKQDMTASVDFTTVRGAGEAAGLATVGFTDQASFLVRLGIGEGVAAIARDKPQEIAEYFARRNVVMDLIDPGKLGRIKVLLQGKGVQSSTLRGFADE